MWDLSFWCGILSSCGVWVFLFSSCGAWAPERVGSVLCGTRALQLRHASSVVVVHGLSCPTACGILVPQPGIEPGSPALEGGFLTTGPPGKSPNHHISLSEAQLLLLVSYISFHKYFIHIEDIHVYVYIYYIFIFICNKRIFLFTEMLTTIPLLLIFI